MDSFKGSLDADAVSQSAAKGLAKALPGASLDLCPLADGGEGTLKVLLSQWPGGMLKHAIVTGPLPNRKVNAAFGWWPSKKLAVIEAARACGLPSMGQSELRPLETTTFGAGELIRCAMDSGADEIILAVGGSATMDGGLGAARALGWQALDGLGLPLDHGGGALPRLTKLIPPKTQTSCRIAVWHDVTNPLTGPQGAAPIFGPQKGASPQQIETVARGFYQLSSLWPDFHDHNLRNLPGGGAAGGLAAGMCAFFGATLAGGAAGVAAAVNLENRIACCDWVITGEGQFDHTSLHGKVVGHTSQLAKRQHKPLILIAGSLAAPPESIGAKWAHALLGKGASLEACMENAAKYLFNAGQAAGEWIGKNPAT